MNRNSVTKGGLTWAAILPLLVLAFVGFAVPSSLRAQVTATLSGTVEDQSGGVIPGAQVTLTNEATKFSTAVQTNGTGLYAFPSLVPGTYDIKAAAKGFKNKVVTGIVLNAGDVKTVPAFALEVGAESQTVTVSATSEMIPTESGAKTDVLTNSDISNLALVGRDTTELIKVLPGATTVSNGLTNASPMFSDLDVHVQSSSVGMGMNISGAIYRSGTALLNDGANIIDVGDMGQSLDIVNPNMTAEVSVQSSNFGADTPFGPVVISTISKSGGDHYHGEAYFDVRNSVLNANDWQENHQGVRSGAAALLLSGRQLWRSGPRNPQEALRSGAATSGGCRTRATRMSLTSYIPTPEMMAGRLHARQHRQHAALPERILTRRRRAASRRATGAATLAERCLPDGEAVSAVTSASLARMDLPGPVGRSSLSGFLDPGAAALAKIWPRSMEGQRVLTDPATSVAMSTTSADTEHRQRLDLALSGFDYRLGDNTSIYGQLPAGIGLAPRTGQRRAPLLDARQCHPVSGRWRDRGCSAARARPGTWCTSSAPTTTNDFMAAWAFGSFPFTEPDPKAAYRTTLGYPYGNVFGGKPSLNIPAYTSAGNYTFPDFSQASIFDNPPGQYGVRKEAPQFGDTLTKVWGAHTLKLGGFTQTTDNGQAPSAAYLDGNLGFGRTEHRLRSAGTRIGSPHNSVANFLMGARRATARTTRRRSPIWRTCRLRLSWTTPGRRPAI